MKYKKNLSNLKKFRNLLYKYKDKENENTTNILKLRKKLLNKNKIKTKLININECKDWYFDNYNNLTQNWTIF